MRRFIFVSLLFFPVLCFTQESTPFKVSGKLPSAASNKLYQIQVGAFRDIRNAEGAYKKLRGASLNPVYDKYLDFTRVAAAGIKAGDVAACLKKIQALGFREVWIREDIPGPPVAAPVAAAAAVLAAEELPELPDRAAVLPAKPPRLPAGTVTLPKEPPELSAGTITLPEDPPELPDNTAALPEDPPELPAGAAVLTEAPPELPAGTTALPALSSAEIGFRTIKVGETKNVADLAQNKNIVRWSGSTPSSFTVNSNGDVSGISIGSGFISINENEYISIAVVPAESFYIVPEFRTAPLPPDSRTADDSEDITEYRTEPTFRLAYRFNNRGENKGASGRNGGIDILARGENYEWLWTTYHQGGWFYDLNGIKRVMVNGYQKDEDTGVELTVNPEFIYDNGVPYLQMRHILRNTNSFTVTGQRFGASADITMYKDDNAVLLYTPYGAYMTDSESDPTIEFMFIGQSKNGISPVNTLWLGLWDGGTHLAYIYDDKRTNVIGHDTAMGFSYKNINLNAGESKEFIVRLTFVRKEH